MRHNWRIVIVVIAVCLSATCWADGRGQAGAPDPVRVTIEKKSLETLTTNTGEKFALSESTIIVDMDGQQVSIRKMLVPCDAEVSFLNEEGRRVAQLVFIKQVSAGANQRLSAERPE